MEKTKTHVATMQSQVTTTLQLQKDLAKTTILAHQGQMQSLSDIKKDVQASSRAAATVQSELEKFHGRFRIVEGHLIEVKAMLQMQKELPQRIMASKIISIIDPVEANTLTIPLDTIDCFEALFAIFSVRFKHKSQSTFNVLCQNYSIMYDRTTRRQIDGSAPWISAFKVQWLLSMLFRDC